MKQFLVFFVLFASCNFAPKYARPEISATTWRLEPADVQEVSDQFWWKQLGDDTLSLLIDQALASNNDLQIAIWRVDQYYSQYQVARSPLFPQIGLNSSATKEKLPLDEDFLPPGTSSITPDYRLLMNLSYEIDLWGQIRNQAKAANFEYLSAVEYRRTVLLTLIGAVAKGYFLLRQLDAQRDSSEGILKSRKESLVIAEDRFKGGLTSQIEVDQALSIYQESIAKLHEIERKIATQENLLSVLLGQDPGPIPRGKTLYEWNLPETVGVGTPEELLSRRPDILQAENRLKAAYANIGIAKAAFFPQITFASLYGIDSLSIGSFFAQKSRTWSIGASLVEQVFTGGALTGKLHIAKALKQELLFQYRQTILKAFEEVNNSMVNLEKSKQIATATRIELGALRDYLKLAWDRYYEGQTEYLTVLDAERQVFAVELNLAEAEAQQYQFLVDLYKSLGGGWILQEDQALQKRSDY